METNRKNKKVVFLCPGQEYLFYTSGVFYLWELADSYHVVLLLDWPFENIELLEDLKRKKILLDFVQVYSPNQQGLKILDKYKKHLHYRKVSLSLVEEYKPVAIIQHSDSEVQCI